MHRFRMTRAIVLTITLAILVVGPAPAFGQSEEDVEDAKQSRESAIAELEAARSAEHAAEDELFAALERYEEVSSDLEDLTFRLAILRNRLETFEADVRDLRLEARDLAVRAYMNGGTDTIDIFFELDSFNEIVTSREVLARASDTSRIRLDRLDVAKREMDRLRADFELDQGKVFDLRVQADAIVAQLDELFLRRIEDTADARVGVTRADAELLAAERALEEERIRQRLAELAKRAGAAAGLAEPIPGFVCPVDGPVAFINSWGFPRSGGRSHKGTDMFAPRGTPLVAPDGGVVTLSSNNLGGLTVWFQADHGIAYYYAHLDAYGPVQSGQRVGAGQVIGYVGNTGNARFTSPHLHIQMHPGRRGSAAVNPFPTMVHGCR